MKRKNIWRNLSVGMLFAALPLIAVLPLKSGNDEPAAVRPPVVRMYQYKFPGATENVLTDSASSLRPFFDRLRALEDGDRDSSPVSICHVGDSHIQADYQTGLIRRMFQDFFGNAGRGLIVPLRLAKTNEPRNYRISSSGKWEGIRCIKPGKYPVGIGGMVLVGNDSVSSVKIQTLDLYNPHKWSFNQITVFYDTCRVELSAGDSIPVAEIPGKATAFSKQFKIDSLVTSIDLSWRRASELPVRFYGVDLRNGQRGVLYHAIGINGAHYEEYADSPGFMQQINALNPDLVVISMGINEAYDNGFHPDTFYKSIDRAVKQIRDRCPEAVLLLTTPAETWYKFRSSKQRKPHPNIVTARKTIVRYAVDHQLAYWDLFSITGGKGSAATWRKHKLLQADGIHFTQDGYEFIGELFFEALYNAYNESQND